MKRWFIPALVAACLVAAATPSRAQQVQETTFDLTPQKKFISCFAQPGFIPTAQIILQRGTDNDVLILRARHLKPGLGFDLFTIQNSNLLSNGQVNPNFKNFGLAWYQSDFTADSNGNADIVIKSILIDQIFGFDPAVGLPPTNTLHAGFWFDNPVDAEACGFDPTKPTPFNGQHKAGPNAMISLPDDDTDLGPLCTAPVKQGSTFVCNINQ